MTPEKFFTSTQTLNTDRISEQQQFYQIRKHVSEVFINPYPTQASLKFPKNKNVRKQTEMTMLSESRFNPQKLCIKPFQKANKTTLNNQPQTKRIAKFGECNPLSKSLEAKHPQIRTFEDVGVKNNMKKTSYLLKYKPDPIIVGEPSNKVSTNRSTILTDPRKSRDNGDLTKQQLTWKVNPSIKRQFYGNRQKKTFDEPNKSEPDFNKVLNYHRRK